MAGDTESFERFLPYALREKSRYYLDFVKDRLFDVAREEGLEEFERQVEDEVETIFLLRLLYGYIVVGHRNYTGMLQYFRAMGVDGFLIGTTQYSFNSSFTTEWRDLANQLEQLIAIAQVDDFIQSSLPTDEVIRRILRSRSAGREGKHHG